MVQSWQMNRKRIAQNLQFHFPTRQALGIDGGVGGQLQNWLCGFALSYKELSRRAKPHVPELAQSLPRVSIPKVLFCPLLFQREVDEKKAWAVRGNESALWHSRRE